ncbi:MAG: PAS domain S-box protein [Proteobacteria bacterium]|nr:PAS domain S-box protein [Pseudomonadota bacterium]
MTEAADRSISMRCTAGVSVAFVLFAAIVLFVGPQDYPNLHTILDTGMALLSGVLVLVLWDMGSHSGHPLYKWLAASFAVTSGLEILHVLVTVEWSGVLSPIAAAAGFLRPATWPPATHVLPVGIGSALWLVERRGAPGVAFYAAAAVVIGAALFLAFQWLPTYTSPILGVTRPTLILAPPLWLAVGLAAWRMRANDRISQPLAWMAGAFFLANTAMLYSAAAADAPAMVAHFGKISGYLILLLSVMQMATLDTVERIRAEAELAQLNRGLERRIHERTATLEAANQALHDEVEQRKAADERLHQSTALLQATFDAAPFPVSVAAPDTTVLMWNRAAERAFGYRADEVIGRRYVDLIRNGEEATFAEFFRRSLAGESLVAIPAKRTARGGKTLDISFSSSPVYGADGTVQAVVCVLEDVTQKIATEAQLRQAQKMEAVGQLTGGLAHDFNNLLLVIIGNLGLLRELRGDDREVDELAREAHDAARRGADLTRSLLAFARRQPLQPRRADLNALVTDMSKLLGRTLGEHIEIAPELAADTWPVVVDPVQLEAALANLATNARDAMPKGGRLTIATANRRLDADYAAEHPEVTPGDYAVLQVSDTGAGMPPDVLEKAFEPFFTTKSRGEGTGLGLSMVFGFMKQSGGHINVYSEVGVGTTFRLYLPRARAAVEDDANIADAPAMQGGRGERVLVVEDNAAIRRLALRQLGQLGYRAEAAENATAALQLLEQSGPFDLVFSDVVMAGKVDGFDLARIVGARWPHTAIVMTSGFPDADANGHADPLPNVRSLAKPYQKEDLARLVREALDGRAGKS